MNTSKIKNLFLNFFKKNDYIEMPESPLILENDKSLLFVNSGMVQFKNIFLGLEKPIQNKVITIQKCIRLGGKHNDLDNIGKTLHHNTSFQMMGNFSFTNTNKEDSINLAINFLLNELNLEKENIYITVHKDDTQTFNIWLKHIKKEKIFLGTTDNFWQMAENGPCGYCTEIFYNIENNSSNPKLLEIWNLVFINFNKQNEKILKLKDLFLDTGIGLERIASIKQNVFDNFKTDIFVKLIDSTLQTLKINESNNNPNIRIIADHIKTSLLIINENIIPSNEGRGYILKKLLRKSIIKKNELNTKIKLYNLTYDYINILNENDIKIDVNPDIITKIIKNEEIKFDSLIKNSNFYIKKIIQENKTLSGKNLFILYDTYGIPLDIIENITKENNIKIEINEFKKELEKEIQKNKIKSLKKNKDYIHILNIENTNFLGYQTNITNCKIIKIIKNNVEINSLKQNESGIIITDITTFYAEKGGQIGDSGYIENEKCKFYVKETKEFNNVYFHYGIVEYGEIKKNDLVITKIDELKRQLIANNHSATHLLHSALKKILGNHVRQAGSLINENNLRFDFIHFNQLSEKEKKDIENIINGNIKNNLNVQILFDDNNKNKNRIIKIGNDISKEFCAGTHVNNTSEIGLFKITKEYGIGNNIRRIEAITNKKILDIFEENDIIINNLNDILKTNKYKIIDKIKYLIDKNKDLEKNNEELKLNILKNDISKHETFLLKNNIKIIKIINENNINYKHVLNIIKNYKNTLIISLNKKENNININILISSDIKNINACNILTYLKSIIKCEGGGNNNIANGIIYDNIKFNEIIKYIQLYLEGIIEKDLKC